MAKFEELSKLQQEKVLAMAEKKGVPISAVIATIQCRVLDKFTGPNKSS